MSTKIPPPQTKPKVWLFLDREWWPEEYEYWLNRQGYADAKLFPRPSQCLRRAQEGLGDCDILLIHKDLGWHFEPERHLGITAEQVIEIVHESAPYVRIGVVSGEYPDGEEHVKRMGGIFI